MEKSVLAVSSLALLCLNIEVISYCVVLGWGCVGVLKLFEGMAKGGGY